MADPWLILETSGRVGSVGVAIGDRIAASQSLDGAKRHNRDLIPTCAELLAECGFQAKQLAGVIVGIGPGSYTGLRVGLTAAKGFAFATGCEFIAVPSFHTLATQAPAEWPAVEVIGDALQNTVYHQRFGPVDADGTRTPASELGIVRWEDWKGSLKGDFGVAGPGAEQFRAKLSGLVLAATVDCQPRLNAVLQVSKRRQPLSRGEWYAAEPLYLRGSSAEEKARQQ